MLLLEILEEVQVYGSCAGTENLINIPETNFLILNKNLINSILHQFNDIQHE